MSALAVEQIITNASVLLSIASLLIIVCQPASKEQKLAMTYTLFSIITCLGYGGIIYSNGSEELLVFATKLKYGGALCVSITFLLLLFYIYKEVPKWFTFIFAACIAFFLMLIFSFDATSEFRLSDFRSWMHFMSRWLFKGYYPEVSDGVPFLRKINAWGHTFFVLFIIGYSLGFLGVLIHVLVKKYPVDRVNFILLYIILTIPAYFYLFEKIFIKVSGYESLPVVPVGFDISNALFVYLIVYRKFCDVNVLATPVVFDAVNVPAVVLDRKKNITNINSMAQSIFPTLNKELIGRSAELYLFAEYEGLMSSLLMDEAYCNSEESYIYGSGKVFRPHINVIKSGKLLQGYVIWLDDVTLLHEYRQQLEQEVEEKTSKLQENVDKMRAMRDQMVLGFSSIAEHHDLSSKGHIRRTANYTEAIARELLEEGKFKTEIDPTFVEIMGQVAPLHDIGKTYIDRGLLDKAEKLTPEERSVMEMHTVMGAQFIETTMKQNVDPLYAKMAYDVALSHHEWWNGEGYPNKISGEQIPLCARIMAVADVYDALVTKRPYKKVYTSQTAYEMIHAQSGIQFDPRIVEAFERCRDQIEIIRQHVDDTNS